MKKLLALLMMISTPAFAGSSTVQTYSSTLDQWAAAPSCANDGTHAYTNPSGIVICTNLTTGGSGTVNSGSIYNIPVYPATGTLVGPSASLTTNAGGTLNIAPSTGTIDQGLNVSQGDSSATVAGAPFAFNAITVSGDDVDAGDLTGNATSSALDIEDNIGGSNMTGSRTAITADLNFNAKQKQGTQMHDFSGGTFRAISGINDGGTSGTAEGALYGVNASVNLTSGGTYWQGIAGGEIDLGIGSGASAYSRIGWSLVGTGAYQASNLDAAIAIGAATNAANGWANGIYFSNNNGEPPLYTNGCMICTDNSTATITNGLVAFPNYTFTGDFLEDSNFAVQGNGQVAIGTTTPYGGSGGYLLTTVVGSGNSGTNIAYFGNTGAHPAEVLMNDGAGGQQVFFEFEDAGTSEWQFGKGAGNNFFLEDNTSGKITLAAAPGGSLTLGEDQNFTIDNVGRVVVGAASSHAGQATCWTTGGAIGYCTSSVSGSGSCSCSSL